MKRLYPIVLAMLMLAACTLSTDAPTRTPETINPPTLEANPTQAANTPIVLTQQVLPSRTPANNAPLVTPGQFSTPTTTGSVSGGTPLAPGTILVTKGQEDDRYVVPARTDHILILSYDVQVLTGTVAMTMQGADGVVWQKLFTTSEKTDAEIPIRQGGDYEVLINVEQFDGNYSMSWSFRRS
jgi:hypothetical protein